jgi:hypothetical protein
MVSIGLALIFSAILLALHFLRPELDPSWRMLSEYEIGRFGWMMRLAFFCWGGSVLALVAAVSPSLLFLSGAISRWWLVVIAIALFGAGIFKTDPITDLTSSWVNRLHQACGTIVILTFPIAATIACSSLLRGPGWSGHGLALILTTAMTWVGLVFFFGAIMTARVRDPTAGMPGGPHVKQGWPNRFLVMTYVIWIIVVASIALRV